MSSLIDADAILSENEEWKKLEEEWKPVDLEVDVEDDLPKLKPVLSTLDLKTTFDSSFLFKKVRRKVGRQLSRKSTASGLEYNDFISHLQNKPNRESSQQFFFINGQLLSAASIEDICNKIDELFKSIEQLPSATSTVRKHQEKKGAKKIPDVVQCSISATDLSFDDTSELIGNSEHGDSDTQYSEIDRHIEEALEQFNSTVSGVRDVEQSTLDSVTTLVRKFSSVLNNPVNCSPRRRRECCEKFRELADFWKNRAFDN